MSRIDFTPALTTTRGRAASVPRSADSSNVCCAPRWTPPRPPVEKTLTPARWARWAVAATVVPALSPLTAATGEVAEARLDHGVGVRQPLDLVRRQAHRRHAVEHADRRRRDAEGADALLGLARDARFVGRGSPCVKIVDSSASTGAPAVDRRPHFVRHSQNRSSATPLVASRHCEHPQWSIRCQAPWQFAMLRGSPDGRGAMAPGPRGCTATPERNLA